MYLKLENASEVEIKKICMYIVENLTYISKRGAKFSTNRKVKGCKKSIDEILKGCVGNFRLNVPTSQSCYTIDNSNILSRNFKLVVVVKLPLPHRNATLSIPLVIGASQREARHIELNMEENESPTYWQTMLEDKIASSSKR